MSVSIVHTSSTAAIQAINSEPNVSGVTLPAREQERFWQFFNDILDATPDTIEPAYVADCVGVVRDLLSDPVVRRALR
jgi:hypothetical protein